MFIKILMALKFLFLKDRNIINLYSKPFYSIFSCRGDLSYKKNLIHLLDNWYLSIESRHTNFIKLYFGKKCCTSFQCMRNPSNRDSRALRENILSENRMSLLITKNNQGYLSEKNFGHISNTNNLRENVLVFILG